MKVISSLFLIGLASTILACDSGSNDDSTDSATALPTTTTTTSTTMPPNNPPNDNDDDDDNTNTKTPVRTGQWGGEGIQMTVFTNHSNFKLDCARGRIREKLLINQNGFFAARGTITLEHGGPIMPGEELPTFSARFTGRVTDKTRLRLRIEYRNDVSEVIRQERVLEYGQPGSLTPCL